MKIILDLTIVKKIDKITGIERVAVESVKSILNHLDIQSNKEEIYILVSKNTNHILKKLLVNLTNYNKVTYIESPFNNRILTDQIWLPYIINKIKPSYVFYTTLGIPLINRFPFSIIIHDAVAWAMPTTISKGMRYYYKPVIEKSIKNNNLDKVMTVSNFSKQEIIKYLGLPKTKIFVNYLGISDNFTDLNNIDVNNKKILEKYNLKEVEDYIISIGTIEPRKNINGLIKSFKILKSKYNYQGKLVIVGREGWIDNFDLEDHLRSDIIVTGYIEDNAVPVLLKNSKAFIFPSYYEGFGLPLIEAMALGVPILCSDKASLPEIGDEACLYFNPESPDEMANQISKVLANPTLMTMMSKKGKERAGNFTWEKYSANLVKELF